MEKADFLNMTIDHLVSLAPIPIHMSIEKDEEIEHTQQYRFIADLQLQSLSFLTTHSRSVCINLV